MDEQMKMDFEAFLKTIYPAPKVFGTMVGKDWEYGYAPIQQMWIAYQAGFDKAISLA